MIPATHYRIKKVGDRCFIQCRLAAQPWWVACHDAHGRPIATDRLDQARALIRQWLARDKPTFFEP